MKENVNLKDGGKIEVRIKDGLIETISYENHGQKKEAARAEKEEIQFRLKNIFDDDNVERFKEILTKIKEDEEFYSYGKQLLDARRQKLTDSYLVCEKEYKKRMAQLMEEIKRFALTE